MTTDTHAGTALREGQEVSLSDVDDERILHFVVVESDGREVTVRSVSRLRTPYVVGTELRVRYSVIDDASYQGRITIADHADHDGCPEYRFPLPGDLVRLQARNFRRLALLADDVAVTLTPVDGGAPLEGRMTDISAGGAGVALNGELDIGTTYRLQGALEVGGMPLDVNASVVRSSPHGGQYGLRFVGLRRAVEDKIVAFVLRQGLQRS